MRTKKFTFKKTVKTTKTFNALEVNLLPEEAKELAEIIQDATDLIYDPGTTAEEAMAELFDRLKEFVEANGLKLRPARKAV